ncbi:hypothetical protein JY97_09325 [Alkalispirochaeta odontotermitis]|nr:hypothetical protein JY97_09325 [Alkalispirochaeta odontotermitis]CAB1080896.1 hypothetical protein D1AOALGA4SA_8564 [Olavius algarvensis Delta 1 endosymbiont]
MKYQDYGDWSLGIHRRLSPKRIPISGSLEITQRCNNQCVHCYNNLSAGDLKARQDELTFADYRGIIDEIVDAGCLWLLLTGGEVFVRRDFLDIYTYARHKGLLITIFTNATLVTSGIADHLAQFPPFSIEVSLYGHTKETYESITRNPGTYEQCINGIKIMRDRRLPVKIKTMVITANRHELRGMKQFVENDLGLEFKYDAMINPRRDCSQSPLEVRLSPAEIIELDLQDGRRTSEWRQFARRFNKPITNPALSDKLFTCGGGQNAFAIDAYGGLSLCMMSPNGTFDLRRAGFKAGWQNHLLKLRQQKISKKTKCSDCQIKTMCGMCPVNSQLECRDAESPVDFLCQVAHLRAYVLSLPIAGHGECEYCPGGRRYEAMMATAERLKERFA